MPAVDHRHAGVAETAQHSRCEHLRAVEELEKAGEDEIADGEFDHRLVGGIRQIEEAADEDAAGEKHRRGGEAGIENAEPEAGPPRPLDALRVAGAIGEADPTVAAMPSPSGTMKVSEAIWMAMAWAARARALIRPIRKVAALKTRHLEDEARRDRQADLPDAAEALPVGAPQAPEQMVAAKPPIDRNEEGEAERT